MAARKVIQLVAWQHVLIALTDTSEIWLLHGLQAGPSGTESRTLQWEQLLPELPPLPDMELSSPPGRPEPTRLRSGW